MLIKPRLFSGGGDEYYRLMKMHEGLKDIEELFAKYRMDRFTEYSQVDALLSKGIIDETLANNLKKEIDIKQEAAST
jgi:hypothetical protein